MRVNRNYVLTEYVLNENDCTQRRVSFVGAKDAGEVENKHAEIWREE